MKTSVVLSPVKIRRITCFLYIDSSCFIISKNIRSAQDITLPSPFCQLEFSPKPFNIYGENRLFFDPLPSKCRFFQIQNTYTTPKLSAICFNFFSEYVHSAKNFNFLDVYPLPLTPPPPPPPKLDTENSQHKINHKKYLKNSLCKIRVVKSLIL